MRAHNLVPACFRRHLVSLATQRRSDGRMQSLRRNRRSIPDHGRVAVRLRLLQPDADAASLQRRQDAPCGLPDGRHQFSGWAARCGTDHRRSEVSKPGGWDTPMEEYEAGLDATNLIPHKHCFPPCGLCYAGECAACPACRKPPQSDASAKPELSERGCMESVDAYMRRVHRFNASQSDAGVKP